MFWVPVQKEILSPAPLHTALPERKQAEIAFSFSIPGNPL